MSFSFDIVLLIQIVVGAIVASLLVSGLLYYFWPNVWHYIARKFLCVTSPCVAMYKCCCGSKTEKKRDRHEPHYMEPERASTEDPMRQSKTKADRKLRIENPKRREREMSAAEELSARDSQYTNRLKAQATRVEKKVHKQPTDVNTPKKTSNGFKYQFEEEKLSDEVNPYISSSATPLPLGMVYNSGVPEEDGESSHKDSENSPLNKYQEVL